MHAAATSNFRAWAALHSISHSPVIARHASHLLIKWLMLQTLDAPDLPTFCSVSSRCAQSCSLLAAMIVYCRLSKHALEGAMADGCCRGWASPLNIPVSEIH